MYEYEEFKLKQGSLSADDVLFNFDEYCRDYDNTNSLETKWQLGYVCALRDAGKINVETWYELVKHISAVKH